MINGTNRNGKRMLAVIGCGAALLGAGCGSDKDGKGIPPTSVSGLQNSLDSIQQRFELGDGACRDIIAGDDTDVKAVQSKLDALPSDVDKDVRSALEDSFQHLFDLVQDACGQTSTQTETTPPETTETVTETAPTSTETTPTETTPTETTTSPEKKQKPKENGKGKNKGQGGSGGEAAPGGD